MSYNRVLIKQLFSILTQWNQMPIIVCVGGTLDSINGQMGNYVILEGKAKCNTSTYPAHSPFLLKCQLCSLPNLYLSFMFFKKPCQGAPLNLLSWLTDILQYKQPTS